MKANPIPELTREDQDRFEANVFPEPMSGCFLWAAACAGRGYGTISIDGKDFPAHRVAYVLAGNELSTDDLLLHKCDVRCCVSPDHLYIGDSQRNASDLAIRERGVRGSLPYGVHRKKNRFQAQTSYAGNVLYLGSFKTIEEAARVAAAKRRELHGHA